MRNRASAAKAGSSHRKRIKRAASREEDPIYRYGPDQFRVVSETRQVALLADLQRDYENGGLALYLGAGVSASARVPTWRELIQMLLVGVVTNKAFPDTSFLRGRGRSVGLSWSFDTFQKAARTVSSQSDRPLVMMAREIENQLHRRLAQKVADTLYIYSDVGEFLVDDYWVRKFLRGDARIDLDWPLIQAIVELVAGRDNAGGIRAIVNYNFDDLVEEMIRQHGIRCVTVGGPRDPVKPGALLSYHVHGVVPIRKYLRRSVTRRGPVTRPLPAENIVFSEEQYHRLYAEPYRWSSLVQLSMLGAHNGLFVGLSMEDPNIRRLLDATHRQYPHRRNYAILKRGRPLSAARRKVKDVVINLAEDIEWESFAEMGVHILWVDEFEDIPKLLREIAGMPHARDRRHGDRPRSRRR